MTERVDILVTGLDPTRPRAEVIAALAAHLTRSAAEIELLLEVAPSPLVRAVSADEAGALLTSLRALGALVSSRGGARESAPVRRDPDIVPIPSRKRDDDARTDESPTPASVRSEPPPPPEEASTKPMPIVVHDASEWFAGGARAPAPPPGPSAPPLDHRPSSAPAKFGRASTAPGAGSSAPRTFFAAIPRAVAMAMDARSLRSHLLASLLGAVALALAALGLRLELELGPLLLALGMTAAVGFTGLVLQLTSACLAGAAAAEGAPAALPGRLMEDYLRPGVGVALVLALLAWLADEALTELAALRATRLTLGLLWSAMAVYGALGFTLSAANGSALGFLDLASVRRLLVPAPMRGLAVTAIGGIALGGSGLALARLVTVAVLAPSVGSLALDVLVLGPLASLAVSLAAAATGAVMGRAIYASR